MRTCAEIVIDYADTFLVLLRGHGVSVVNDYAGGHGDGIVNDYIVYMYTDTAMTMWPLLENFNGFTQI